MNRPSPNALADMALLVLLLLLATRTAAAQVYVPKIAQIERTSTGLIRFHISVTDSQGNPTRLPESTKADLILLEGGKPVPGARSSVNPRIQSLVLVLDVSGSMNDKIPGTVNNETKLIQAKEAIKNCIDFAPANLPISILNFNVKTYPLSTDFVGNGDDMKSKIGGIRSGSGGTALQDAVGAALDILKGRVGRKAIVVITDGRENSSKDYGGKEQWQKDQGLQRILNRAEDEGVSIDTFGFGGDVDADYLKRFEVTRGRYYPSPDAGQLKLFLQQFINLLTEEIVLEYWPKGDQDGTNNQMTVGLRLNDREQPISTPVLFTKWGVIPHVRGNHLPFLLVIFAFLIAPGVFIFAHTVLNVRKFRQLHTYRLQRGSPFIGQKDPNMRLTEYKFSEGDVLVLCPLSRTPYHVRSWRNAECKCMREHTCSGYYCYHRALPRWLRYLLDSLWSEHIGATGRAWLCRCAGDKEGY
jgi:hypothetical protein